MKVKKKDGRMSFSKSLKNPKPAPNKEKKGNKGTKSNFSSVNDGHHQINSKQSIRTYKGGMKALYPNGKRGKC